MPSTTLFTLFIFLFSFSFPFHSSHISASIIPFSAQHFTSSAPLKFQNVFSDSGLATGSPTKSLKYGGPCVADLDSDGHYDIILTFHNRNWTRIYFGNENGTFDIFKTNTHKHPFRTKLLDVHGVSVAQLSTTSRKRLISFSVGGSGGARPRAPEIYTINPKRQLTDVSNQLGFGALAGRPRTTLFMDLQLKNNGHRRSHGGGPDALFVNFLIPPSNITQYAYSNINGKYSPVTHLGDFGSQKRGSTELTDIDGDGVMEVISIQELRFYRLTQPFQLMEITPIVRPKEWTAERLSITAVVEFDFDNDGHFDLYVATAQRLIGRPRTFSQVNDLLLRNDGGKYTDVSEEAQILKGTNSVGVTCGDFNNDGYVDLLVVLSYAKDVILLNQGNATFTQAPPLIPKQKGEIGNQAVAVDYDLDGRLDAIVGHGGVKTPELGRYLLMRNVMFLGRDNHYLHVTVYNDPTGAATSLHAVVKVFLPKGRRMVRRVGSRGAQAAGVSYLDTVHFGLGGLNSVAAVRVRWSSRLVRVFTNVAADQRVFFGVR